MLAAQQLSSIKQRDVDDDREVQGTGEALIDLACVKESR